MGFADIDGLRIHYHTAGDLSASHGQRVLYVHGTSCDGRVWQRHMQAIAGSHTSVAIDLPGHGKSSGDGFRGVADYTHYTIALADRLGWDRFVIAGHSLGGGIALTSAVYYSERLAGMMLIDTGARLRVDPDVLENARRVAVGEEPIPIDPGLGFAKNTPQSVLDAINTLTADSDPRVTYKDWISDDTFDFMSRVGNIAVSSIAICGEEDYFTPVKYAQYLADRMPNCQLAIIQNAGHWTYAEQPETFDRIVQTYLANLESYSSS
jgi:pimeloyl-ACP methyl ester carboxylesterase